MFNETGHFSINLLRPGRPKFGYRDFPPVRVAKAALEGIITMFGTYKVNEIEHSVSLDVIGGSYPTWDNSHQKRFITINGDELTYRNLTPASGGGTAVVILVRALPNTVDLLDRARDHRGRWRRRGEGSDKDMGGDTLTVGDRITWSEYFFDGQCYYGEVLDMPQKCHGVRKYGHDLPDEDPHFLGGFAEYCYILPGTLILKLPGDLS